jgi:hypothetical protein
VERSPFAVPMTTKIILEKLLEIERALQQRDCLSAHHLLFEAQDRVLQLEREMIERQEEKVRQGADGPHAAVPAALIADWSARAHALVSETDPEGDGMEALLQALARA